LPQFREITDEQIECAMMLTLTPPSVAIAQRIASDLGANVVARADTFTTTWNS
jgi:hypothetical protein